MILVYLPARMSAYLFVCHLYASLSVHLLPNLTFSLSLSLSLPGVFSGNKRGTGSNGVCEESSEPGNFSLSPLSLSFLPFLLLSATTPLSIINFFFIFLIPLTFFLFRSLVSLATSSTHFFPLTLSPSLSLPLPQSLSFSHTFLSLPSSPFSPPHIRIP